MKFRSYNAATATFAKELGDPGADRGAELSQALATGVAESFISSGSTGYDRAWEHLTHYYKVNASLPRNYVIIKGIYNGLDGATKDALHKAADETAPPARGRPSLPAGISSSSRPMA